MPIRFKRNHAKGSALLALIALLLFVTLLFLLLRDIGKTANRPSEEPPAVTIANTEMALVKNPENGWFPPARNPLFGFENGTMGWLPEDSEPLLPANGRKLPAGQEAPLMPSKIKLETASGTASEGNNALTIPVDFPSPVTILRSNGNIEDPYRIQGIRFIAYDVYLPQDCPGFAGALFFMKNKDGLWYQARSRAALLPGKWTTLTADLRGGSPDVTPLGHAGQWDDNQASGIRTLGMTFYGDKPYKGKLLLDNIRGWTRPQRFIDSPPPANTPDQKQAQENLKKIATAYKEPALKIINFRTLPAQKNGKTSVTKFDTLELRFELNRQTDNPFDPDKADIFCEVTTPSGKILRHNGFWYQDFDRAERGAGDVLQPIGRPEWRVRVTPREEGAYSCALKVNLTTAGVAESVNAPKFQFTATPAAPEAKGFVRVSQKDPRFFEYENGDFYYPVGHNTHSPVDIRCWKEILKGDPPAGRGLPMYEDFFPKISGNGGNTVEIWMASWWVGIEWTNRWPDFHGVGRYSLQNAWKLDTLLAMARENGLRVHLVLDNHGKLSNYCDWEWELNPYNSDTHGSAGFVRLPQEFFESDLCKKWHRNKLRYIAARWGADPTIMGFELVSEYDLVGGGEKRSLSNRVTFHKSAVGRGWVREMLPYLKMSDPYDHPVTNHYATDYQWVDSVLAAEPQSDTGGKQKAQGLFDYVVTDAYRQDKPYTGAASRMQNWAKDHLTGDAVKPYWITEYGGDFNGTTIPALHGDVECGMWATWMTDGAGCPLLWWFDFIDVNNLYPYYGAFGKYIQGEDRRGIKGETRRMSVDGDIKSGSSRGDSSLAGSTYLWENGAYGWVYSTYAMSYMPPAGSEHHITNATSRITDLKPGKYKIEYWDCYKGVIVKTDEQEAKSGHLKLEFPAFNNNMAFKVKPVK